MMLIKQLLIAIALTIAISLNAQSTGTNSITVHIKGVKNDHGVMRAFLFNSEDGFLKRSFMTRTAKFHGKGELSIVFDSLPKGDYAVNVYHDRNNNNELDSNWMRIPKEPYGFSNNVRGKMGPPKFEEAKFPLNTNQQLITINLK